MFGIGLPELIIICFIVLLIFGAGKLPEIMSGMGKGLRDFKDAVSFDPKDVKEIDEFEKPIIREVKK